MAGFFGLLWYVRGRGGDRMVFVERREGGLGKFSQRDERFADSNNY